MIKTRVVFFLFCLILSGASFASECPQQAFKQYAKKLDKTKLGSVTKLKEYYFKNTIGQPSECRVLLFRDFRLHHAQMIQAYGASVEKDLFETEYPHTLEKVKKYSVDLFKVGLYLYQEEGTYFTDISTAWYLKIFGNILPISWKKYLKQRGNEEKNKFLDDTAVMISWDALRVRLLFWERFLKSYPDFSEKNTAEELLSLYHNIYLTGSGNTPIYSGESKKLRPDIQRSYETFIQHNTTSQFHKELQHHYTIIQKNNYVVSNRVNEKILTNMRYSLSQKYNKKSDHAYPYVCYEDKSKDSSGKIIYKSCIRSDMRCKKGGLLHFGGYFNDLKAHQAFERCIGGKPRFVDSQGM